MESQTVRDRARSALIDGLRATNLVVALGESHIPGQLKVDELLSYLENAGVLAADEASESTGTEVALELKLTCAAMPEQYEAFLDGRQVGYLRLRHGTFRAHYPDHIGSPVYITKTLGDGIFDDSEREDQIRTALIAVLKADGVENPVPVFELPERPDDEDWDLTSSFIQELGRHQAERRSRGRHS